MAHVFAQDRRWKLAEAAFLRAIELNPSASHTYVRYVDTLLALQGRASARNGVTAGREQRTARTPDHVPAAARTARPPLIYAGLGDQERAFDAFERAVTINWQRAAVYLQRPEMRLIQGDPRVLAIKQKLGLPE